MSQCQVQPPQVVRGTRFPEARLRHSEEARAKVHKRKYIFGRYCVIFGNKSIKLNPLVVIVKCESVRNVKIIFEKSHKNDRFVLTWKKLELYKRKSHVNIVRGGGRSAK